MRKSDFLDQLRLEVGLVYDYATNKEDFLKSVLYRIYELVNKKCMITLYKTSIKGSLDQYFIIGEKGTKKEKELGLGFLNLCANNASFLLKKEEQQVILSPIFGEGKLEYILACHICADSYSVSSQDMDFVNELIRFIEVKNTTFTNIEKED